MKWVLQSQTIPTNPQQLLEVLLANRNLKRASQRQEFLHPTHPTKITPQDVELTQKNCKAVQLILKQKRKMECVSVWRL